MYVLERGRVNIVKTWQGTDYVIHSLERGDFFGEIALLDFMPRSASVVAEEDCQALVFRALDVLEIAKQDIEQFTMIYMNLCRELVAGCAQPTNCCSSHASAISTRWRTTPSRSSARRIGPRPAPGKATLAQAEQALRRALPMKTLDQEGTLCGVLPHGYVERLSRSGASRPNTSLSMWVRAEVVATRRPSLSR